MQPKFYIGEYLLTEYGVMVRVVDIQPRIGGAPGHLYVCENSRGLKHGYYAPELFHLPEPDISTYGK